MGRSSIGKHPLKYGCPYCDKKYTSRSGLLSHKNTIHLRRKPYRCEYCNEHFFTSAARVAHIHRWHSNTPKSQNTALGCSSCGQVFFSSPSLEEHIKTEHGGIAKNATESTLISFGRLQKNKQARNESYTCLECGKIFLKSVELIGHLEEAHQPPHSLRPFPWQKIKEPLLSVETSLRRSDRLPPYSQPQKCCQRVFDEPLELEIHNKYHHRNEMIPSTPLYCNMCTREFKDNESLSLHQSLYCGLNFLCNFCDKRYKNVGSFIKHIQSHHHKKEETETSPLACESGQTEERLTCPKCGIAFFDKELYDAHIQHHNRAALQECVRCSFSSSSPEELRHHYEDKHSFKCDVCFKIFSTSRALSHHKNVNHLRSGLCPLCPTDCHTLDLLLVHLEERHTKDVFQNPRSCQSCSFETLQVHSYLYHMKHGHAGPIF